MFQNLQIYFNIPIKINTYIKLKIDQQKIYIHIFFNNYIYNKEKWYLKNLNITNPTRKKTQKYTLDSFELFKLFETDILKFKFPNVRFIPFSSEMKIYIIEIENHQKSYFFRFLKKDSKQSFSFPQIQT